MKNEDAGDGHLQFYPHNYIPIIDNTEISIPILSIAKFLKVVLHTTPHSFSRVKFNMNEHTHLMVLGLFVCLHSIKMNYVNESEMKNKFYSFALYVQQNAVGLFCLPKLLHIKGL